MKDTSEIQTPLAFEHKRDEKESAGTVQEAGMPVGGRHASLRDYRAGLLFGFWRGRTLDSCLWRRTDGYMARYYSRDMLSDVFQTFFAEQWANRRGSLLVVRAKKAAL